eukprot:TRINITY_DN1129_c0_g4_i1.p1 TRINITY_DN1129_c0_g4~~TRINITY_DN1129_c0_g4_i1.p1  ORF type:complete len:392 (-),score=89.18 TRINITY_DN1129_c0_g4_i1:200-1258(-)
MEAAGRGRRRVTITRNEVNGKLYEVLRDEAKDWLAEVLGAELVRRDVELQTTLRDGSILCKLALTAEPGCIPKYHEAPRTTALALENMEFFLALCRKWGLPGLFVPLDLYDNKNMIKIVACIHSFAACASNRDSNIKNAFELIRLDTKSSFTVCTTSPVEKTTWMSEILKLSEYKPDSRVHLSSQRESQSLTDATPDLPLPPASTLLQSNNSPRVLTPEITPPTTTTSNAQSETEEQSSSSVETTSSMETKEENIDEVKDVQPPDQTTPTQQSQPANVEVLTPVESVNKEPLAKLESVFVVPDSVAAKPYSRVLYLFYQEFKKRQALEADCENLKKRVRELELASVPATTET